jgi:hypothetical protein
MNQYRICVQKKSDAFQRVDNLDHPKAGEMRASFLRSRIWNLEDVIKIYQFPLEKDFTPPITPMNVLTDNGQKKCDPLEHYIRSKTMTPQEIVKLVVRERIIPLVGIKIIFVDTPEQSNVRVKFQNDGCWSYVGTENRDCVDFKEQTVNFGWIDVCTVMHEFGHVLGLIHEHQSSLGKHIEWDNKAVYKWALETQGWTEEMTFDNIINQYNNTLLNGSHFDPKSIMLYFFPAELTKNKVGTVQNITMSYNDRLWFSKMYPRNGKLLFIMVIIALLIPFFLKAIYNK